MSNNHNILTRMADPNGDPLQDSALALAFIARGGLVDPVCFANDWLHGDLRAWPEFIKFVDTSTGHVHQPTTTNTMAVVVAIAEGGANDPIAQARTHLS